MERLRILLVDDFPEFTWDKHWGVPRLPLELSEHFELIWVQNALEARWLLEAVQALSFAAPYELLKLGLPTELLIFDYALTQHGELKRSQTDVTYLIPRVARVLEQCGIELPALSPEDLSDPPSTGAARGKDSTGCYVGGAFARSFAAHPCGAVPTTAHVDTSESDAAFYEWLNSQCFMDQSTDKDLFKHKTRTTPTWDDLLPPAVRCLRERIARLSAAGIIRVQLTALLKLAEQPDGTENGTLIVYSRFGRRELPVKGLFVDSFVNSKGEGSVYNTVAAEWARRMLEGLFKGRGVEEFSEAKDLSERYWNAATSEEAVFERDQLSTIAGMTKRNDAYEIRMEELCEKIGISSTAARTSPEKVRITNHRYVWLNWKHASRSDAVARWAALLLTVRAETAFYGPSGVEYQMLERILTADEKETGEIEREQLESRVGEAQAQQLIENLGLEIVDYDGKQLIQVELRLSQGADASDVLSALDPLPESLFLTKHKGRTSDGQRIPDWTFVTNPLKRLGHPGNGWGPLGLSLSDVLKDRPFNCELCRIAIENSNSPPAGEHKDKAGKKFSHGLRRGEGSLLRMFADELGFEEPKWPAWLRHAI